MSVYHFDCAVMRGHSASGEILQDDDFKTLTCTAERIPSDFKPKLRALFPDVNPSKKLIIIGKGILLFTLIVQGNIHLLLHHLLFTR